MIEERITYKRKGRSRGKVGLGEQIRLKHEKTSIQGKEERERRQKVEEEEEVKRTRG